MNSGQPGVGVLVGVNWAALVVIALADAVRETSGSRGRVQRGQSSHCERIAAQPGIDTVLAEVLPGEKQPRSLTGSRQRKKVAMVGDGVNDHGGAAPP